MAQRERQLLQRLQRHELAVEDAQSHLREAQIGFLMELGWERDREVAGRVVERWVDPKNGTIWGLAHALEIAKGRVESGP